MGVPRMVVEDLVTEDGRETVLSVGDSQERQTPPATPRGQRKRTQTVQTEDAAIRSP